jgi:hypothetical protein
MKKLCSTLVLLALAGGIPLVEATPAHAVGTYAAAVLPGSGADSTAEQAEDGDSTAVTPDPTAAPSVPITWSVLGPGGSVEPMVHGSW